MSRRMSCSMTVDAVNQCAVYSWCVLHDGHRGHHQRLQHLAGRLPADHVWLRDGAPWELDELDLLHVVSAGLARCRERGL
jgi:hypothetical protein